MKNNYKPKTKNYKKKNSKSTKKRTYKKRPTKQTNLIVGKIYAEWCGYCQMMQDDWDNMKRDLGENKHSIEFVEIEQKNEAVGMNDINNKYLKKSPVKLSLQGGYPTIFKIKNGGISYFNGNRVLDDMKQWCLQ